MKRYLPILLAGLLGFGFAGCEESAADLGIDIMPSHDAITTSDTIYRVLTRSIPADGSKIAAVTNDCYLGSIIDPETGIRTTCDFLAQYHIVNGFSFPPLERMVKGDDGLVHADSVDLTLYFDTFMGDTLSTMKLTVHELDPAKTLSESQTYYTDLNPRDFLRKNGVKESTTYSIHNLASGLSTSAYYRTVNVRLPQEYGDRILQSYYTNPEYFTSSYQFIHNVCPGFYFEHAGGVGAMLKAYVSALHVYYSFKQNGDSVVSGLKRMASTTEVLQSTRADNSAMTSIDTVTNRTYLRTPSGLYTEVTLPIESIETGEHRNDSINNARIIFRRSNSTTSVDNIYRLSVPENVLLLPKDEMYSFFASSQLPNNRTSYLGTFDATKNAYIFSNIANLISELRKRYEDAEGALSEDWNKVVLIPVNTQSVSITDAYGQSTTSIYGVRNMYGPSSVALEGGSQFTEDDSPVELSIIYSRYADIK